jgi:putative flippase GtrA
VSAKVSSLDSGEFVRFAVVGCLNVAVSFTVFLFFFKVVPLSQVVTVLFSSAVGAVDEGITRQHVMWPDAALATGIGYLAGMVNSFLLNKHWTFKVKGNTAMQIQRFVAVNAAGLLASSLSLFVFVDLLGGPYGITWFVTTGAVMVVNYYGSRYWTFAT